MEDAQNKTFVAEPCGVSLSLTRRFDRDPPACGSEDLWLPMRDEPCLLSGTGDEPIQRSHGKGPRDEQEYDTSGDRAHAPKTPHVCSSPVPRHPRRVDHLVWPHRVRESSGADLLLRP